MSAYIVRRLLFVIPTLFGIMLINFAVIQFAPGGPVEQAIANLRGDAVSATARISGADSSDISAAQNFQSAIGEEDSNSRYRGARGIDPKLIQQLEKQYGMDKPPVERFWIMLRNYVTFDFGKSFYSDREVVDLVLSKMPVSISIGLWTTLIAYGVSIPLGIRKAVSDGSRFDVATSTAIILGYAIPSFLFAVLLIVVFAGGSYFQWFPLRGLVSENWEALSWPARIADYFWHMSLPILAMVVSAFAGLTMLTKNSFVEEVRKQYVTTARAKGVGERRVLYGHVFRNAMLIVIAGFPGAFIGIFFSGALLIEIIFSLDGLGLLGFEAALSRDYPIMFGTLFFFSLIGLVMGIVSDLMYVVVDPRIDFERRFG